MKYVYTDAKVSKDGRYRYTLDRRWVEGKKGTCLFVMLNPSTADGLQDDPTIRRCVDYAASWGYDALRVVNLSAFRATKPAVLLATPWEVAHDHINDSYTIDSIVEADLVVFAWGANVDKSSALLTRAAVVTRLANDLGNPPHFLKKTKSGQPAHPLMLRKNLLATML